MFDNLLLFDLTHSKIHTPNTMHLKDNIEAILSYWHRAPIIQYVIEDSKERSTSELVRKLDEVYPF